MKKHFAMVLGVAAAAGALVLTGCNNEVMQSRTYVPAEEEDFGSVIGAVDPEFQSGDQEVNAVTNEYEVSDFPDYTSDNTELTEVQYHTVQKGENPSVIAKKYGISANELMTANDIKDPRKLKIGQQLVIPAPGSVKSVKSTSPVLTADGEYVVQAGDTVSKIAKAQGMKTADIMAINGLDEAAARRLRVGQKLKLPGKSTGNVSVKSPSPTQPVAPVTVDASGEYTVKAGDTVAGIAAKLKVKSADLMAANGLTESSARNLQIGQKLRVPGSSAVNSNVTPTPTFDQTSIVENVDQPVNSDVLPLEGSDVIVLDVEEEISVKDLAAKHRITPNDLRNANNPGDIPADDNAMIGIGLIFVPVPK